MLLDRHYDVPHLGQQTSDTHQIIHRVVREFRSTRHQVAQARTRLEAARRALDEVQDEQREQVAREKALVAAIRDQIDRLSAWVADSRIPGFGDDGEMLDQIRQADSKEPFDEALAFLEGFVQRASHALQQGMDRDEADLARGWKQLVSEVKQLATHRTVLKARERDWLDELQNCMRQATSETESSPS